MVNPKKLIETFENKFPTAYNTTMEFFGMKKKWLCKRNLLGAFLVIIPEIPAYFIPAFSQARATGDATDIKKGEGPRGLITGGLEGVAVSAIVAGEKITLKHIYPFVILGAGLQFVSSKVFPIVGEKFGRMIYKDSIRKTGKPPKCKNSKPQQTTEIEKKDNPAKLDMVSKSPQIKSTPLVTPQFNSTQPNTPLAQPNSTTLKPAAINMPNLKI